MRTQQKASMNVIYLSSRFRKAGFYLAVKAGKDIDQDILWLKYARNQLAPKNNMFC
jgi:hypothetical protein